jgi:hypothetical protein
MVDEKNSTRSSEVSSDAIPTALHELPRTADNDGYQILQRQRQTFVDRVFWKCRQLISFVRIPYQ